MAKKKAKKAKPKVKPKTKTKAKQKAKPKKSKTSPKAKRGKVSARGKTKPKTKLKAVVMIKEPKPIGFVTHYFNDIDVAIVRFNVPVVLGTAVHFKGATTDFKDKIVSMQYEHVPISVAKKGREVGIKVKSKVREGDRVHFV